MQEGENCAVTEFEVEKVKLVDLHKETLEEGSQLSLSGCVCKVANIETTSLSGTS